VSSKKKTDHPEKRALPCQGVCTLLVKSCRLGDLRLTSSILKLVCPSVCDKSEPLREALCAEPNKNQVEICTLLAEHGAVLSPAIIEDALAYIIGSSNIPVLKWVLANVENPRQVAQTALDIAIDARSVNATTTLLQHGARFGELSPVAQRWITLRCRHDSQFNKAVIASRVADEMDLS
jgi:hypothetical protein